MSHLDSMDIRNIKKQNTDLLVTHLKRVSEQFSTKKSAFLTPQKTLINNNQELLRGKTFGKT